MILAIMSFWYTIKVPPALKVDVLNHAESREVNPLLINAIVEDFGQCLEKLLLSVSIITVV